MSKHSRTVDGQNPFAPPKKPNGKIRHGLLWISEQCDVWMETSHGTLGSGFLWPRLRPACYEVACSGQSYDLKAGLECRRETFPWRHYRPPKVLCSSALLPTKIDHRKKGYPYSHLSTGRPSWGRQELTQGSSQGLEFLLEVGVDRSRGWRRTRRLKAVGIPRRQHGYP